jgi:hypothetical protein
MCILRFHARAGYLQSYETLLKEINEHPGSELVEEDQYGIESVALADSNFNVACETGNSLPFPGCHAQPSIHAVACNGNISYYACIY